MDLNPEVKEVIKFCFNNWAEFGQIGLFAIDNKMISIGTSY